MSRKFAVQINMASGDKRYVNFRKRNPYTYMPSLIKERSKATVVDYSIAEILSDWFNDNWWRDELFYSRELVEIKTRPKTKGQK